MRLKLAEIIAIGSFLIGFANVMKFKKKLVTWIFGIICALAVIVVVTSKQDTTAAFPTDQKTAVTTGSNSPAVIQSATASGGGTVNQAGGNLTINHNVNSIAHPGETNIQGTTFTHQQISGILSFDYCLLFLKEDGTLRHELYMDNDPNSRLNWEVDWDNIKFKSYLAASRVVFEIPVRTDAQGLALSRTNYTILTVTSELKTGAMSTPPVNYYDKPVLNVVTLSDNQRKPVFAIGFRITNEEDRERILKASQK